MIQSLSYKTLLSNFKNCTFRTPLPYNHKKWKITLQKQHFTYSIISQFSSKNSKHYLENVQHPHKIKEVKEIKESLTESSSESLKQSFEDVPRPDKIKEVKDIKESLAESSSYSVKDYEEKFWEAYEQRHQTQQDFMDPYPDRIRYKKVYTNPLERTYGILRDDLYEFFGKLRHNSVLAIRDSSQKNLQQRKKWIKEEVFPHYCDVIIIGGGLVGTSVAFHLQERARNGLNIVVVEKDLSYSLASSLSCIGGIRQQFSLPENIILSKYGMDFLQQVPSILKLDDVPDPCVSVTFGGYLTLASEKEMPQLLESFETQKLCKSFVKLLSKDKIKDLFPWISTDGIEAGIYGTQREGWFDPWSLLLALNRKCQALGTRFVNGTVIDGSLKHLGDFVREEDNVAAMKQVLKIDVLLPNGEKRDINCAICVIAAGVWSKDIGLMLGVGSGIGGKMVADPIPVEPRKRSVYCCEVANGPGLNCPLVVEPDGTYFRREGLADQYLCSQPPREDPPTYDLSVDQADFLNILPTLARRCSAFENAKVQKSWAGYYDYNTFDQNGIIGRHPMYSNLYVATGFSGHGVQQAAGAGKAISELILDAELKTLDIERMGFERIILNRPLHEYYNY